MKFLRLLLLAIAAFTLAACGRKDSAGHGGGHAHQAPHGGTLIELGDHGYNLELVRDAAAGRLTAYVLDGHAENFIRIAPAEFGVLATVGAEKRPLNFRAVANSATGETVGNTSQFEATADWLKTTAAFDGVIPQLEIRGTKFEHVAFRLPGGAAKK